MRNQKESLYQCPIGETCLSPCPCAEKHPFGEACIPAEGEIRCPGCVPTEGALRPQRRKQTPLQKSFKAIDNTRLETITISTKTTPSQLAEKAEAYLKAYKEGYKDGMEGRRAMRGTEEMEDER